MSANLSEYCVTKKYTLQEALDQIQRNKNRNVFILDDEDRVVGILSQGDAVRALCRGTDIHVGIDGLYSPSFFYLTKYDWDAAMRFVRDKGITLIPIVDDNFQLVDVITPGDIIAYLEGLSNE